MLSIRSFIATITMVSLVTSPVAMAVQPPPLIAAGRPAAKALVQDVALLAGNTLEIQIVDEQGKPHAGTPLQIRRAGKVLQESVTGRDGRLVVAPLAPGVYQIASGPRSGIYRLWAPRTAPPRAARGVLLIDQDGIVRGVGGSLSKAAILGGVIVTSGVAGGVVGYNLKDAS